MIVEIPDPADFQIAGLNQLYLAWQITMQAFRDFDYLLQYGVEDDDETRQEYWHRSQPALANAYSLIQQGMELALKGRIVEVSPLLLIDDPGDGLTRATIEDVSFGEFRTLNASDLISVYNGNTAHPLNDGFASFWNDVRRERNKIMHTASPKALVAMDAVFAILMAVETLFPDKRWPAHLLALEHDGRLAALGINDDVSNEVMHEIELVLGHLAPADAERFLGFDKGRRAYLCPNCHSDANRDWQEKWPHLAQFPGRARGATLLTCIVCEAVTEVERQPCEYADCKGNVIADDVCLTCTKEQELAFAVISDLTDDTLVADDHTYEFAFGRGRPGAGGYSASDRQRLLNDDRAKEHGAFAMNQAHLQRWTTVSIIHIQRCAFPDLTDLSRVLGHWRRQDDHLEWVADVRGDRVDLSAL